MKSVALYTFGVLDVSATAAQMDDFRSRAGVVYANAKSAPGHIGHAEGPMVIGQDFGAWGAYAIPTSLPGLANLEVDLDISTLSVWRDVESARQFVYGGDHRAALALRRHWFLRGEWPGSVLWRLETGTTPHWCEGVAKLESLAARGDAADHFTFGSAWAKVEGR
jgi:hypothetical protein